MNRNRSIAMVSIVLCAPVLVGAGAGTGAGAGKVSVKGEVIDSACYVKSGAKGESHRECCSSPKVDPRLGTAQRRW